MKEVYLIHSEMEGPSPRKGMLELAGYHVTCMGEASTCLNAIEARKPALIVVDTLISGMNGFKLLERIRQHHNGVDLPVILCTEIYTGSVFEEEARRLGAQHYFVLPVVLDKFVDKVNELTDVGTSGKAAA